MYEGDTVGMTNGYPYAKVFQTGIAKKKRSVISKVRRKKPIVKKVGK